MINNKFQSTARRVLFTLLATFSLSHANMINGVALSVNEVPITLYDIDKTIQDKGINKAEAVSLLVDEVLYNNQMEKENISVDIFELNDYLERIAKSNGMDLYTFKSVLRQQNQNYEAFEANTKKEIMKRKLAAKIVQGNLKIATEDDLKIYYENNKNKFSTASSIEVTQYSSKDRRALQVISKNPMANVEGIAKSDFNLEQDKLNSQLKFLLNDTTIGSFTPIVTAQQQYVMFYVKNKNGVEVLPFEEVKEKIFNTVMNEREQKFLKDYFEKLKLTADIKVIR